MEGKVMRTLADLIARHHRGDRDYNRTSQCAAFDTTVENDSGGDQGVGSGDAGCYQNSQGQSGDNVSG